jgi:hypothetical protein
MEITPKRVYTRFIVSNVWQQSDSVEILNATNLSDDLSLSLSSTIGTEVHR